MSNEIKDKELQDRFLDAVDSLSLKFPGAEIAAATSTGESTVSAYLTSKREVSAPFLRRFCEAYGLDLSLIKTGKLGGRVKSDSNTFTADQLFAMFMEVTKAQTAILGDIRNEMARRDSQARMETNLQRVFGGLETIGERQDHAIKQILADLAEIKGNTGDPS